MEKSTVGEENSAPLVEFSERQTFTVIFTVEPLYTTLIM